MGKPVLCGLPWSVWEQKLAPACWLGCISCPKLVLYFRQKKRYLRKLNPTYYLFSVVKSYVVFFVDWFQMSWLTYRLPLNIRFELLVGSCKVFRISANLQKGTDYKVKGSNIGVFFSVSFIAEINVWVLILLWSFVRTQKPEEMFRKALSWGFDGRVCYSCTKECFLLFDFLVSRYLYFKCVFNPGRNNDRNFSGIRALMAVKTSHRSRY